MNITNTTPQKMNNNCSRPNFTAHLKGSAVRMAIQNAKDPFQLSELDEIIKNVNIYGDTTTIINCNANGTVFVSNDKLGKTIHKFNIKKNEKSDNPFLEMLRRFNSRSNINKYELNLFDEAFARSKNKQSLYDLYKTYSFNSITRLLLEYSASKHPEIKQTSGISFKENNLEDVRKNFLKTLSPNF